VQRPTLQVLLRPDGTNTLELLNGWVLPLDAVSAGDVCYCAGVGENIDFELSLLKRVPVEIFAFDPTPRAAAFIRRTDPPQQSFKFFPVGVSSKDETLRFYAPDNPGNVSYSVVNPRTDRTFFDAPCRSVGSLMREFGHTRLGLLKLNIEGAEYGVLRSVIKDGLTPTVIALTFEGPQAFRDAVRWTKRLRAYGYDLSGLSGWAATFVLQRPTATAKTIRPSAASVTEMRV
jgi:FkbM family methyltransferase